MANTATITVEVIVDTQAHYDDARASLIEAQGYFILTEDAVNLTFTARKVEVLTPPE